MTRHNEPFTANELRASDDKMKLYVLWIIPANGSIPDALLADIVSNMKSSWNFVVLGLYW